jgi:outer membrane protein OmpU
MKKVLFATTALVATAGVAAADVTITGSAEMGIAGGSVDAPGIDPNTTFFQSVDVRFAMTGEADNGLSFGATIDLDDLVDTGADPVDVAGAFADFTVFISGDFGTLTMGDTDGAFDWALTEANFGSPGSIADDETAHAGYNGNAGLDGLYNGQVLRYDYSIGDFGIAVSAEVDGSPVLDGDPILGIGLRYGLGFAGGEVDFGLGYQSVDDTDSTVAGAQGVDLLGVSVAVALDMGLSAAINYTQIDDGGIFGGDGEHTAIGISYEFDAITLHANYGEFDWDPTAVVEDSDGWGLAAAYDLGGGLSAHLGYGSSSYGALNAAPVATLDNTSWSFGLAMSF